MATAMETTGYQKQHSRLPLAVSFFVALSLNLVMLFFVSHYEAEAGAVLDKGRLVVESLEIGGGRVQGDVVKLKYGIKNVGESLLKKGEWSLGFLLSEDDEPSADDVSLGGVSGGESIDIDALNLGELGEVKLPTDKFGDFYVIAVARDGNKKGDTRGWYLAKAIEVSPLTKPDMAVMDMRIEFVESQKVVGLEVSYLVKNVGYDSAVGQWRDVLVLSRDRKFSEDDVVVGEQKHKETFLLPTLDYLGESTIELVVDDKHFDKGEEVYLLVVTDVDGVIDEGGRIANNTKSQLIRLGTDKQGKKELVVVEKKFEKKKKLVKQVVKKLKKNETVLGSDDGGGEPTVAWISYKQFLEEVRAAKSKTHQPALQRFFKPLKNAPIVMRPTGNTQIGSKRVGGRVASSAGVGVSKRRTFDRGNARDQASKSGARDGRLSGRQDKATAKKSFKDGKEASQFDAKSDDRRGEFSINRARKDSRLASASKRGTLGTTADGVTGGRDSLSVSKAKGEHQNALGEAQDLDEADSSKDGTAERAKKQKLIEGKKDLKGKSLEGNKKENSDESGQRGKAKEGKGGRRFNPKKGSGKGKKVVKGDNKEKGTAAGKAGKQTSVPLTRAHVGVTSLTDSPLVVRLGRVITVKGIEVDPVSPHFGEALLVARRPRNPQYKLTFDHKTGEVIDVKELVSTGYVELDSKIQLTMFYWKARGKELKKMKTDFSIKMTILLGG